MVYFNSIEFVLVLVTATAWCSPNRCNDRPDGTYLPDANDFTKYIECKNGKEISRSCPTRLIWDDNLKFCNYPANKCAGRPDGTYLPNPEDPIKYIECKNGKEVPRSCPFGQLWKQDLLVCNYPSANQCAGVPDGTYISNPNDITKYIECKNGTGISMFCQSGLVWDAELKFCNYPTNKCTGRLNGTYLPDPDDSTKYIECKNEKEIFMSCPSGLIWYDNLEICNYPANRCIGRPDGTHFPNLYDPTKYIECRNGTELSLSCPSGLIWDNNSKFCNVPTSTCAGRPDGTFLRDPSDATKYIECKNGKELSRTCQSGLIWDDTFKFCNFPGNSTCIGC